MLALLACSTALVAAHAGPSLSDEVVLLQQLKTQPQEPLEDQFQLICDPEQGCHYLLPSSSTPVPYQLVCDDARGCHYTGVTPPPKEETKANPFQMPNQAVLLLLMKSLSEAQRPHPSSPQPHVRPPQQVRLSQIPGLPRDLPTRAPEMNPFPMGMRLMQLSNRTQKQPSRPALLRRWSREYQGAFNRGAHLVRPNVTSAKWLIGMLSPEPSTTPPMEGTGEPQAYFIPDNGMWCVQGPVEYIRQNLAKVQASPIGDGYRKAEVTEGLCQSKAYENSGEEKCFPKARLFFGRSHPINPFSEQILMAKYALKHGMDALKNGMENLCGP